MTFKFSPGDRVRVLGKAHNGLNGRVGEVLRCDQIVIWGAEPPGYLVRLDGGYNWWFSTEELEREAQPPTEKETT